MLIKIAYLVEHAQTTTNIAVGQNARKQDQAITMDFMPDGWTTQDFSTGTNANNHIAPILLVKEEGRRPDW